jgi:hypothetical protein
MNMMPLAEEKRNCIVEAETTILDWYLFKHRNAILTDENEKLFKLKGKT